MQPRCRVSCANIPAVLSQHRMDRGWAELTNEKTLRRQDTRRVFGQCYSKAAHHFNTILDRFLAGHECFDPACAGLMGAN